MPFYPSINSLPEAQRIRTAKRLLKLKTGFVLENIAEKKVDGNLLLATWNIREFGGTKFGGRDAEPLLYIAEIINRFDLVALQEIRDDIQDLREVMSILGSWWKVLFTDVTVGRRGNKERTGFLYDSRKITFGGLVGEIVLPPIEGANGGPSEQLSRTPMIVGFRAGWFKFTICTTHLYYGKSQPDDPRRLLEMSALAKFLSAAVKEKNAWAKNMIVLGDFNVFKTSDETFKVLVQNGFTVPTGTLGLTTNLAGGKHFDQIAFIAPSIQDQLEDASSGVFQFQNYVYTLGDQQEYLQDLGDANYKTWRTYKMSDHLPLWVELKTDFSESYLSRRSR